MMKNENYPLYEVELVSNLKELVNFVAEKYNDNPAFIYKQNKEIINVNYRQFKSDIEAFSTALFNIRSENIKVAMIGENSYEWIVAYFAVVNSGNIIIPLDRALPPEEIKNLMIHSETKVLIFSNELLYIVDYLKENGTNIQRYVNINEIPDLIKQGKLAIRNGANFVENYEIDSSKLTALLYTSGTTGSAKGIMLSHKNIVNNVIGYCQIFLLSHNSLLVLPLHHSFFAVTVLSMIFSGTTIVINKSLKDLAKDFNEFEPYNIAMVPLLIETLHKQILKKANGSDDKKTLKRMAKMILGNCLTTIISGGAPLDKKYVKWFRDLGILIFEGYGLTECSAVVSCNRNHFNRDGSVGQILPTCKVKILDPDITGLGEICVKGDIIMLGYYKNEQATKEAFDGEWFKTGDIGYLDEDGFLYISGRKKNVIILSNGKNVYPEELEFTLVNSISYIKEVVVYAENDMIVAEVFLNTEIDPDCASHLNKDIINFNQTQAPFKNIGKTVIRDTEFPKTTTKKIKRQYK